MEPLYSIGSDIILFVSPVLSFFSSHKAITSIFTAFAIIAS